MKLRKCNLITILKRPCILNGKLPASTEALVGTIISTVTTREEAFVVVDDDTLLRNRLRPVLDEGWVGGVVAVGGRDGHPLLPVADVGQLDVVRGGEEFLHDLHPGVEGEEVQFQGAAGHPVVTVDLLHAFQPSSARSLVENRPVAPGHWI